MSDPLDSILDLDVDLSEVQIRPPKPVGKRRRLFKQGEGNDYIFEVDWSSLDSFLTCDRAAFYKLVLSRTTYGTAAMNYGRAMHKCLESWHTPSDDENPIRLARALIAGEMEISKFPPSIGEWRTLEQLKHAFTKYTHEYPVERFDVFDFDGGPLLERGFAMPLGTLNVNSLCPWPKSWIVEDAVSEDPFHIDKVHVVWTGVTDGVVVQNGELWNIDHKTTSRGGPTYFRQFELSQQFIGYTWAASALIGQPLKGTLLNVIFSRKPTRTGKVVECERRFYDYSEFKRQEWQNDMITFAEDFMHRLNTANFPKKTSWCVGKYGTCPYLSVCCADSDAERSHLINSDTFADNVWNPLDNKDDE